MENKSSSAVNETPILFCYDLDFGMLYLAGVKHRPTLLGTGDKFTRVLVPRTEREAEAVLAVVVFKELFGFRIISPCILG